MYQRLWPQQGIRIYVMSARGKGIHAREGEIMD